MDKKSFNNYNILITSIIILFFSIFIQNKIITKLIYIISILLLLFFSYNNILIFNPKNYDSNVPDILKAYIANYILILLSLFLVSFIFYRIFV